ncbi:unnamed protein product, partial [Prorocentrum cordatum]
EGNDAGGAAGGPLLLCLACGSPALRACDVVSTSYRIMSSPAYLADQAWNVRLAADSHDAAYSSGVYTVRDVTCADCSARLGITYVSAGVAENDFKVGKFLLSQDQLALVGGVAAGPQPPSTAAVLHAELLELALHGAPSLSRAARRGAARAPLPGADAGGLGGGRGRRGGDVRGATPGRRAALAAARRFARCLWLAG